MTFKPSFSIAPYLQTSLFFPEDFDEFRVRFLEVYYEIASNMNVREISLYDQVELLTGEQWPNLVNTQLRRQTFRKIFFFNDATLVQAHDITGIVLCTHIYGAFTDGTIFYPLPYVDVVAITNQVKVTVSATQVIVVKGVGAPAITNGVIILEYLKN